MSWVGDGGIGKVRGGRPWLRGRGGGKVCTKANGRSIIWRLASRMLTQLRSNRRWNGRRRTSRSAASSRLSRVARISRRTAPIRNVSRNQFCCVIYFYPLSPKKSDLQRGSLRLHESKHSLAEKNNKQCTVPRFPSVCARLPIHSFQQNSTTCKWSFNPLMLLLVFFSYEIALLFVYVFFFLILSVRILISVSLWTSLVCSSLSDDTIRKWFDKP